MQDLIFISMEDWDEVWRRNQFLCAELARRFPDMKILFVGTPRNVTYHLRRGTLGDLRAKATWTVPGFPNITVTRALKLFPESLAIGRKLNDLTTRLHVRHMAKRLGLKNPLLWLNPHSALHTAGRMNESVVVYDITDDWAAAPSNTEWQRELIIKQDRALCARADLVVVCSEALEKSRLGKCKRLLLLPNGVDSDHYAAVRNAAKASQWPRPVFGYTGTLHSDRLDVELVKGLARAFPQGTVLLVGPDHLDVEAHKSLAEEKNIRLLGRKPYSEIPNVMAQFDVCIVPHVETEFTNSLNPIKLWEYLAAGKPIVSSNVAGFRNYSDLCRVVSGTKAFVAACADALLETNDELCERRVAEARNHSWEKRADTLLETLSKLDFSERQTFRQDDRNAAIPVNAALEK